MVDQYYNIPTLLPPDILRTQHPFLVKVFKELQAHLPGNWTVDMLTTFSNDLVKEGMPNMQPSNFKIDKTGIIKGHLNFKSVMMINYHHDRILYRQFFGTITFKVKMPTPELQKEGYYLPTFKKVELKNFQVYDQNMMTNHIHMQEKIDCMVIFSYLTE